MTIDGTDVQLLALDALGYGRKTVNPFLNPATARDLYAKAERAQAHYETEVCKLLREINRTRTGNAVLEAIKRQGPRFNIVIKPYLMDPNVEREIEKLKKRLIEQPGLLSDHYKSKINKLKEKELAASPGAFARNIGRPVGVLDKLGREGKREKALVRFTPANWTYNPINVDLGIGIPSSFGPGSQPDEVLLHELVHAQRMTAGLSNKKRKVPFQERYDNKEEFFAILITNIYHSERGRKYRRSSHRSFWFKSADNEVFLDEGINRTHVRQLRSQQPLLFNNLKNVNTAFNPLRDFRDARA